MAKSSASPTSAGPGHLPNDELAGRVGRDQLEENPRAPFPAVARASTGAGRRDPLERLAHIPGARKTVIKPRTRDFDFAQVRIREGCVWIAGDLSRCHASRASGQASGALVA